MADDRSMRWFVSVSMPKGDITAGVDPRWIESYIATMSAPPSAATVMFAEGAPADVVRRVAEQARASGSGDVSVYEEPWPPDERGWPTHVLHESVDGRDSRWEDHDPRFRVYVFDELEPGSDDAAAARYATATWDLTGFDVLDAIRWAQDQAGERGLYAVALLADGYQSHHDRGLVWLVGMDYQETPRPETGRIRRTMIRRRGRHVVVTE